ncbi:MAG: flagellar biosynthesis anti-sigma factor FlgM [Parashewanella sp.]
MDINTNKLNPTLTNKTQAKKAEPQAEAAKANAAKTNSAQAKRADSVVITAQAQQLQKTQAKLSQTPSFDQKKVSDIKQAIAEGRYKVDPQKLAKNISKFETELSDVYNKKSSVA